MFSLTHMLSNTLKPGVLQHGGGLVRTVPCQKEVDRLGNSSLEQEVVNLKLPVCFY